MRAYVVCFDIEDDRVRQRLGRILLEYGERVQRSVFEIALSDTEYIQLCERLEAAAAGETNVRFYRLCEECRRASHTMLQEPVMRFPSAVIV